MAVTDSASCPGMQLVGHLSLFLQLSLLCPPSLHLRGCGQADPLEDKEQSRGLFLGL